MGYETNRKNKKIYVYRNNQLFGVYKSIEKSIKHDVSVKGYRFSLRALEAA